MEVAFDIGFEEQILANVAKDVEFMKGASRLLQVHHLATEQHSWFWRVAKECWHEFGELPTGKHYAARAARDFPDSDDRKPYIELALKLLKLKPEAPKTALGELHKFVDFVSLQLGIEDVAVKLEKGKLKDAREALRRTATQDFTLKPYTVVEWMGEFKDRQAEAKHRKEHPEDFVLVPTGIKRLDAVIGGIQVGEVFLIMATTGRGKSICLVNIGYNAVTHGYNVAHFSLEMNATQNALRYDSRWTGQLHRKHKYFDWTPDELRQLEKRWDKTHGKLEGRLKIIAMPLRSCTINTLKGALDDLKINEGFVPQLVIIDSGDHLRGASKMESYRLEQSEVYWDMKRLAEEDGYAVISSTHAGKEWATKIATAEAAGESYDKSRIADIVGSINEPTERSRSTKVMVSEGLDDDDDDEDAKTPSAARRTVFYLSKYRDGESKLTIPLDTDFARMLIQEAEVVA